MVRPMLFWVLLWTFVGMLLAFGVLQGYLAIGSRGGCLYALLMSLLSLPQLFGLFICLVCSKSIYLDGWLLRLGFLI